jgi:hypothetical protein
MAMESIPLEPVDSLTVTTLVDNLTDLLLPDKGPAKRWPIARAVDPVIPARFLEPGKTGDALRGEHGFSALVTVEKAGQVVRILSTPVSRPTGSSRTCGGSSSTGVTSTSSSSATATGTTRREWTVSCASSAARACRF